jgi:Tfp pilus assembly protein PilO
MAVSLDGLRAWIGEVERKLGMRTRVFLVLVAIAVGGAGAAIYLAIDARDTAVSESDVQELQQQLEAQIGGSEGADLTGLEAEIDALRSEIDALREKGGTADQEGTASGGKPAPPIGSTKAASELPE